MRTHFRLVFRVPTAEEARKLRRLHRECTREEAQTVQRAETGVRELLRLIQEGELDPEELDEDIRAALADLGRPKDKPAK